jgi:hypothetical protein
MIPLPYAIAPLLAALLWAGVMTFLYKDAVNEHSKLTAALALAEKQAADTTAEHERNIMGVAEGWDAAVRALAARPVVRVQADRVCQSALPTAPGGLKATPAEYGLTTGVFDPREISLAECEGRLNASLRATAQVLHLLDFNYRTHEASQ